MIKRCPVTVIVLMFCATLLAQQPTTNPAIIKARELFNKQDWPAAVNAYEALHRDQPDAYPFLLRIGLCRMNLHEYPQAIDAFSQALALKAPEGYARYDLACAQARAGKIDDAIENLTRTSQINFGRAEGYQADDDLASLRDDPRFKSLIDRMQHPTRGMKGADAFDHWIGEWDVYVGGQLSGRSSITRALDGFGVEEHWQGLVGGERGQSFFAFDPVNGKWRQLWVDDRGWRVEKVGTPIDNGIQLEGMSYQTNGASVKSREFLTKNPDGTVRQLLEDWDEPTKSWQTTFDGKYVRRPAPSTAPAR